MEYYIEPEQAETDFLRVGSPEEIEDLRSGLWVGAYADLCV